MFARKYADYRQPAPLDPERHFYQDGTDPAVRNDDEAVVGPKPETLQDLLRIALVFLQVQRCAKPIVRRKRTALCVFRVLRGAKKGTPHSPPRRKESLTADDDQLAVLHSNVT